MIQFPLHFVSNLSLNKEIRRQTDNATSIDGDAINIQYFPIYADSAVCKTLIPALSLSSRKWKLAENPGSGSHGESKSCVKFESIRSHHRAVGDPDYFSI